MRAHERSIYKDRYDGQTVYIARLDMKLKQKQKATRPDKNTGTLEILNGKKIIL